MKLFTGLRSLGLVLAALWLSGCATGHLSAEQPMALIAQTRPSSSGSYDSPAKRTMAATALLLDGNQRQRFESLLDTVKRHQTQLGPLVRQFQAKARQAFAAPGFSAAGMQAQWQKLAGAQEAHTAGEATVQLVSFWQGLNTWQRQQAEQRFAELQSRVSATTREKLKAIQQRQSQRLREILPGIALDAAQRAALLTMVIEPEEVLTRQNSIRQELAVLVKALKAPGSNIRSLQPLFTPLYRNQRHWRAQLSKLQSLHAKLSPKQRAQLIAALKQPG
ncbi:MAG: hypothetical protein ACAI44_37140 [Candidatus Sericytochromatia bacterium]